MTSRANEPDYPVNDNQCCFTLSDGTRCPSDRDTHSYCMEHARLLRKQFDQRRDELAKWSKNGDA